MDDNVNQLIEDLKEVTVILHRNAGVLDQIIQCIESELPNISDKRYLKAFVLAQASYRADIMRLLYKNLDIKELAIWEKFSREFEEES